MQFSTGLEAAFTPVDVCHFLMYGGIEYKTGINTSIVLCPFAGLGNILLVKLNNLFMRCHFCAFYENVY